MIARFIRTYSVADAANVACSYRGSDPGRCRRRIVADLPRRQPHYPAQKAPPLPQDGIWAGTHRPMPGTLNNWDSPQTGSQRHECRDSLAIYRMTREDAQATRMYAHARNYQSRYLRVARYARFLRQTSNSATRSFFLPQLGITLAGISVSRCHQFSGLSLNNYFAAEIQKRNK